MSATQEAPLLVDRVVQHPDDAAWLKNWGDRVEESKRMETLNTIMGGVRKGADRIGLTYLIRGIQKGVDAIEAVFGRMSNAVDSQK